MKKYIVKIPDPDTNEISERVFYNLKELTSFLDVGTTIIYHIIKGEYAFINKKHLSNIQITKEDMTNEEKQQQKEKKKRVINVVNNPEDIEKMKEFQRKLLSK